MKFRTRKVLIVVVAIWVIAIIALTPLFVAAHREKRNLDQAFNEYTGSLINQQFDQAYAEAGPEFHDAVSFADFETTYKSLEDKYGPLLSAKRGAYEMKGAGTPTRWSAVVDGNLNYATKTLKFEFVFHKDGESWILFSMHEM